MYKRQLDDRPVLDLLTQLQVQLNCRQTGDLPQGVEAVRCRLESLRLYFPRNIGGGAGWGFVKHLLGQSQGIVLQQMCIRDSLYTLD